MDGEGAKELMRDERSRKTTTPSCIIFHRLAVRKTSPNLISTGSGRYGGEKQQKKYGFVYYALLDYITTV
jgi:hypothetical protein